MYEATPNGEVVLSRVQMSELVDSTLTLLRQSRHQLEPGSDAYFAQIAACDKLDVLQSRLREVLAPVGGCPSQLVTPPPAPTASPLQSWREARRAAAWAAAETEKQAAKEAEDALNTALLLTPFDVLQELALKFNDMVQSGDFGDILHANEAPAYAAAVIVHRESSGEVILSSLEDMLDLYIDTLEDGIGDPGDLENDPLVVAALKFVAPAPAENPGYTRPSGGSGA